MTVLEILKVATYYLDNTDDFSHYIEGDSSLPSKETEEKWHKLLQAFNNIIGELATEELFFREVEDISLVNKNNLIPLSLLKNKAVKVISICAKDKKIPFAIRKNEIKILGKDITYNNVSIEYAYMPKICLINDEIDISKLGIRAVALGVASEYSFITGVFDDANLWREMFESTLKKIKVEAIPLSNGRW